MYHYITFIDCYKTMQSTLLTSWLQLLSNKVKKISAEICTIATANASASVGDDPFHVDQQSILLTKDKSPHTFTARL